MKIVLVEFSPSGGLYQFALQMAQAYASQGHQVELLTGRKPELRPRTPGLTLIDRLPTWHPAAPSTEPAWIRKPRRAVRAARLVIAWLQVARYLRRSRPDVVQWAEWRFPIDGYFAARIARSRGPIHVDLAHTPRPFAEQRTTGDLYKESPTLLRALARAYAEMDLVLTLGESARRELLDVFPDVRRVEVIPHGDEGIYAVDRQSPPAAGAQPKCVVFFGTLARYKGIELLLDAFELVRTPVPDAQLVIAGAVADVDITALRERAARIGGIDIRDGYVPVDQVADLIAGARVVAAPYVIANQSGVVHLAQTFARPVVATDVGDLSDAVRHGETGFLVPPGDAAAFAESLTTLLTDEELATEMGSAGLDRSQTAASWSAVVSQVLPVFEELRRGAVGTSDASLQGEPA
jgi:glycosyltransferase involved in cell wall biosynthesis